MTAALSVHEISVSLPGPGGLIRVVDRVSLNLERGEMVGLAGESGCGKSMLALAIMGLLRGDKGHVEAKSVALGHHEAGPSSSHGMVGHRGKRIAMVFQEPTTALDPVFTVGWQISAVLRDVLISIARRQGTGRSKRCQTSASPTPRTCTAPILTNCPAACGNSS